MFRVSWIVILPFWRRRIRYTLQLPTNRALLCFPLLATRVGVAVAELIEAVDDVGFDAELLQELKEAPEGYEDFHAELCPFSPGKTSLLYTPED